MQRTLVYNGQQNVFGASIGYGDRQFDEILNRVRALPVRMRRYDPPRKMWWIDGGMPVVVDALGAIAEQYGFTMTEAAETELIRCGALIGDTEGWMERSRALTGSHPEFEALRSRKGYTLYPFQVAGSHFVMDAMSTILGDEVGTGKTIMSYAVAKVAEAFPLIIVCQASKRADWAEEALEWLPGRAVCVIDGLRSRLWSADVVVVNYDVLHAYVQRLLDRKPKMVVFDEAQYVKEMTSRRTKAALELCEGIDRVVMATGTPVMNRPVELLPLLIGTGRLGLFASSQRDYRVRYCALQMKPTGNGTAVEDDRGAGSEEEMVGLNKRLRQTGSLIRRLKVDVLKELPPLLAPIALPMRIVNRREYDKAEEEFLEWVRERAMTSEQFIAAKRAEVMKDDAFMARLWHMSSEARDEAVKQEAIARRLASASRAAELAQIGALKQVAARGILPPVIRWIEEFTDRGEKLIVFAHHREVQDGLAEAFPGCARIMGGADGKKHNQAWKRQFQNDPTTRLIVCSIMAASSGHTLTAACNTLHVELGWTPSDQTQGFGRAHRIGQHRPVQPWIAYAEGTIYQWVVELLQEKARIVDAITDGTISDGTGNASILSDLMKLATRKAMGE